VCKSLPTIGILLLTKKGISLGNFPMRPSGVSYLYETSLKLLPFSLGMIFAISINLRFAKLKEEKIETVT